MKKSKIVLSEEGTKCYLPMDLWPKILSSVPAKSLVRFRCVSKSWLSMINDPDFRRLHLINFSDKTHQLLVVEDKQRNCVLRCSDTFETNSEALHTLVGQGSLYRREIWHVVCSIDGLVMLKCDRKLRVWNPSIRKFHDVPPLPAIEEYTNIILQQEDREIGLGYDPSVRDYKYVKLILSKTDGTGFSQLVAIYTLGARSWKISPFHIKGWSLDWPGFICVYSQMRVYLQSSLYFIGCIPGGNGGIVKLVSFDLSSEVFSYSDFLQCWEYAHIGRSELTLVDDGCKLAVLDLKCGAMWVLDDGACWSQRYSFGLNVPKFLPNISIKFLYHKKGNILMGYNYRSFSKLAVSTTLNVVLSYNLETETQEILFQTHLRTLETHNVWDYAESLIMLE